MELFKTNNKNPKKTSETKENNYNFEKQKDDALKQFQKLYSKSNNTNPSADKKENIANDDTEIHWKPFPESHLPEIPGAHWKLPSAGRAH